MSLTFSRGPFLQSGSINICSLMKVQVPPPHAICLHLHYGKAGLPEASPSGSATQGCRRAGRAGARTPCVTEQPPVDLKSNCWISRCHLPKGHWGHWGGVVRRTGEEFSFRLPCDCGQALAVVFQLLPHPGCPGVDTGCPVAQLPLRSPGTGSKSAGAWL